MAEVKEEEFCLEEGSSPNEAFFFVLAYLPLFDLLTISRVCRSFRDSITTDILPWLKIVVDRPLSRRITDDILMEITSKAKGRLQVLVLVKCARITDDGLLRVVAQNPFITKLHVPGCTSLSPDGIIKAVMLLTKDNHRVRTLKLNGIYGLQIDHLQSLHVLINHNQAPQNPDRILYRDYYKYSTLKAIETNRSIDLDVCPKCKEVRTIFDCPQLLCQQRVCRACASCIMRCAECGICIKDCQEQDEATCGDSLCLECWLKLPKCNFCNTPYCSQHADQRHRVSGSVGFMCATCHWRLN